MSSAFSYGPRNLRDLCGLRGRLGRVRCGVLFRSAQLDRLSPQECDILRPLGITLALDLRDDGEKAPADQQISARMPGVQTRAFPLMGNLSQAEYTAMLDSMRGLESLKAIRAWMGAQYGAILTRGRPQILETLRCIMAHEGPLVFFCVAGKDRTGIIAMLILLILGVDVTEIRRDYRRTNRCILGIPFLRRNASAARRQYAHTGLPAKVIDTLADAHPDFLAGAIASIIAAGGIDAWLSGEDGIDPALVQSFRKRILMP